MTVSFPISVVTTNQAAVPSDQMNLACQTAPRTSQSLVGPMLRRDGPPPWDVRGSRACASRVLMGPAGGGIDADHAPVDPVFGIGVRQERAQDFVPSAVCRPASMTFVDGLPRPVWRGHITPGHACAQAEEDSVDHCAVHRPPGRASPGISGASRAHSAYVKSPRPTSGTVPPFPEIGSDGYAVIRRADTSISIFMRGSARPHMSMVAAGRTSLKARRSVGQQGSKSARSGSR